jgi:DNA-binding NarL/FixJ family response regulator
MTERIRVLLIDDHEMARRGLEAMLSTADWIEVVGDADDCESGLAAVERLKPDIVMLDIRMPGTDGLACLEQIKARPEPVAVVIEPPAQSRPFSQERLVSDLDGLLARGRIAIE